MDVSQGKGGHFGEIRTFCLGFRTSEVRIKVRDRPRGWGMCYINEGPEKDSVRMSLYKHVGAPYVVCTHTYYITIFVT